MPAPVSTNTPRDTGRAPRHCRWNGNRSRPRHRRVRAERTAQRRPL